MKTHFARTLFMLLLITMLITSNVYALDGGQHPVKRMNIDTSHFGPKIVSMPYFVHLNGMDTSKFGPKIVNMPR